MVGAISLVALAVIVSPILALGTRVPWSELGTILSSPETQELLRVTLASALISSAICIAIGTPLALWMQDLHRGATLTRALVLLPLALPPVVAGLALSSLIGRRGIASPLLDALGFQFGFAFPGVVAAHVYAALPFVVITLDAALRQLDREITDSAFAVGIKRGTILRRIVLPAIAPSIATAAGLAFARSLGEFGTTLTFAGSLPGVTRTMPLGIYLAREIDQAHAYGLAAILIGLAVASIVISALPLLCNRRSRDPKPRATGVIDAARLCELTRPAEAGELAFFPRGATTALIGPNGSGKTTLLRGFAERDRSQRGVILLTQKPGLPPTSTPRKAISMVTKSADQAAALLTAAGLDELADVPVPELSGGQAAQVALVRALASRPGILLLDEPLSALDTPTAVAWRGLLSAAAGERTTVLVTHSAGELEQLADYVAVMDSGTVVSVRPATEERELPSTQFSAQLQGLNRIIGAVADEAEPGEMVALITEAGSIHGTAAKAIEAGAAAVAIYDPANPREVVVHPAPR